MQCYTKNVESDVTSVLIEAIKTDSKSKITGDIGKKNLNYGENKFKINVTSESGQVKTYTLKIIREDNRSKTNTLKSVVISGINFEFLSDTNTYNLRVDKGVEKIKITSTLEDTKSKYVTGFSDREVNLEEGINTVLVKVQAENGDINTYTFYITRGLTQEEQKKNTNISELTIKNQNINFSRDKYEYTILITDETSLDIEVILENPNATYEILNNETLDENSVVIVRVTSEDKTESLEYKINIQKEIPNDIIEPEEKSNNSLYIGIGIFILGLIFFLIVLIYKKKK